MQPFVYTIRGPVFSRKSSFALSIPGRKFIFDLEFGVKRASWRFPDESIEIWQPEPDLSLLSYSKRDRIIGQIERWNILTEQYINVLSRQDIDVIIFDTAKEGWVMCHKGWLQEKQDLQLEAALAKGQSEDSVVWQQTLGQFDYATPNTRFGNLIDLAKQVGKSIVLINHEKDIYGPTMIGGEMVMVPTGQTELDGFRHTLERSDWVIVTWSDPPMGNKLPEGTEIVFKARIDKSPIGSSIVGQEFDDLSHSHLETLGNLLGYVEQT